MTIQPKKVSDYRKEVATIVKSDPKLKELIHEEEVKTLFYKMHLAKSMEYYFDHSDKLTSIVRKKEDRTSLESIMSRMLELQADEMYSLKTSDWKSQDDVMKAFERLNLPHAMGRYLDSPSSIKRINDLGTELELTLIIEKWKEFESDEAEKAKNVVPIKSARKVSKAPIKKAQVKAKPIQKKTVAKKDNKDEYTVSMMAGQLSMTPKELRRRLRELVESGKVERPATRLWTWASKKDFDKVLSTVK